MALSICVGNFGGIAGSNIFLSKQAPKYQVGFGTCLAIVVVAIITAFCVRVSYAAENRRRRVLLEEVGEDAIRARYTEQELADLGDRSPFFIYTL